MDVLQHLRIDGLAFGFDVGDLAADHPVDGSGGGSNFRKYGSAAFGRSGGGGDSFKRQGQKSVAGENGDGFAEFFVASGFAAAEVIVVQRGQIIVDQGVRVDEFDGASRMKRGCDIASKDARRLETEDGANALASREDAVAHGRMNR